MCADNFSGRQSSGTGRHRRNSASRHSLFGDDPQAQAVTPPTRSTYYVGRVGALAVALGIGTAILGLTPMAAADTGDNSGSAGQESSRAGDSGRTPASARTGKRSARDSDAVAPPAAVDAETPGRRSGALRGGASGDDAPTPNSGDPVVADAPSVAAAPSLGGAPQPEVSALPSVSAPLAGVAPTGSASISGSAGGSANAVIPQVATVSATEEAPVMTAAAPAGGLAAAGDSLAVLGEAGTGDPVAQPLAWAALAVARREDLAGATPEVAPAAAEDTAELTDPAPEVGARQVSVSKLDPISGAELTTVTITGSGFKGTEAKYDVDVVTFGCANNSNPCSGVAGKILSINDAGTEMTVVVPEGAKTGFIRLQATKTMTATVPTGFSPYQFTVAGVNPVTITSFSPDAVSPGTSVTITGTGFNDQQSVKSVTFNGTPAASFTVDTPTQITAVVPQNVRPGNIQVVTLQGAAISATGYDVVADGSFANPPVAYLGCSSSVCGTIVQVRGLVQNSIAAAISGVPASEYVGTCTNTTCAATSANYVAAYAFNVVYALMGATTFNGGPNVYLPDATVAKAVVAMFTQPQVLTFISNTVAGNAALEKLPYSVKTTVGNAVATLVQNTLGNSTVATAFVPFLKALNLPNQAYPAGQFAAVAEGKNTNVFNAILSSPTLTGPARTPSTSLMQTSLITFFSSNPNLFASAVSSAVSVLLGQSSASWTGAPPVGRTALADYLGERVALQLLGLSASTPALADTISNAVQGLFNAIGGPVASSAGQAFVAFLNAPNQLLGEQDVPTILATTVTNGAILYMQKNAVGVSSKAPFPPTGVPSSLSGAADFAATSFVNSLFTLPNLGTVTAGLGQFVNELVPGVLGNVGVQAVIADQVAAKVSDALGGGSLGRTVGAQVGAAVGDLLGSSAVSDALATFVNTVLGQMINADGVVTALADAAGTLAAAAFDGDLETVQPEVIAALKVNPAIDAAVGPAVTAGVLGLLGDEAVWAEVDATTTSLMLELLGDRQVQAALDERVQAQVIKLLGDDPFGRAVAAQVGAAVVGLVTTPVVSGALVELVDTVFSDFFRSPGVAVAVADAAGDLATASLQGTLDVVEPEVKAALQSNRDIQSAASFAFGAAVTEFLETPGLLDAVDASVASLVNGLLTSPVVLATLGDRVAGEVVKVLGDNSLGRAVGAQVGAAVVGLVSNPVVRGAVVGLMDTVIGDFFRAPGVVPAFGRAASEFGLALVTGESLETASAAAQQVLLGSPAVERGISVAVGDAVTQFLTTPGLLPVVDETVASLVNGLLTSPAVLAALDEQVVAAVVGVLGDNPLGQMVGAQVGAAVVGLVSDPLVRGAVVGLVDTVFSDFFGAPGVVSAFADAASELAFAVVTGQEWSVALRAVQLQLRESVAIQDAVDVSVGDAVTQFLTTPGLWPLVDATVSSLIVEVIGDPVVQEAIGEQVYVAVIGVLGLTAVGETVGTQVADAVVGLITNPLVTGAVVELVDTVFSDFFGAPGVVSAFADAASGLALGLLGGESWRIASAEAQHALRNSPAVDDGAMLAVGDAVTQFLTTPGLWALVDGTVSSLVVEVIGDTVVQDAIGELVAGAVIGVLGDDPLGQTVGAQVGAAVVGLITNPIFVGALAGSVDNVFSDFFGSSGVVPEFAGVASELAVAVLTGADFGTAVQIAERELQFSPAIDAALSSTVGTVVTSFLTTPGLGVLVDSTVSSLVPEIIGDTVVQDAIRDRVYVAVIGVLGLTELGETVGAQVADAVVGLVTNPVIVGALVQLVDTVFSDFIEAPGVVTAFSDAAGELAVAAVQGDLQAQLRVVQQALRDNPAVDNGVTVAVGDAVTQLLTDTAVWSVVDATFTSLVVEVIGDTVVQEAISDRVNEAVINALGDDPLGQTVGAQAGAAVVGFITNPVIVGALVELVDTVFSGFLGFPGVVPAFADAASELALGLVTGQDFNTALKAAQEELRNSPAIEAGADYAVGDAVTQLLTDTAVLGVLDQSVSAFVTEVIDDSVVQQYAAARAANLVLGYLGDSPLALPVAQAVDAAVQQLLSTPGLASGLGTVIGSIVPDFLGQPDVADDIGDVAGQFVAALLEGQTPQQAQQNAIEALESDPAIQTGVRATIADTLDLFNIVVLSDPVIQQSVGSIVTTFITDLASNPRVETYVAQQYGQPVADLLTNTPVINMIAGTIGSAVTEFLAYPGVTTALTDSLDDAANAVLDGENRETALLNALKEFQSAPATVDAVNTVVPEAVNTILADAAVRAAISVVVEEEVVAALQAAGITNEFIDRVVGQVVEGTVDDFLSRRATAKLLDTVAVNVVLGMPLSEVSDFVTDEVLHDTALQIALGLSIGQGVGSLFGEDIVGRLVGVAAGIPTAVTIVVSAGLINFYAWLSQGWAVAPDVSPAGALPAASSLYGMTATLTDSHHPAAVREALLNGRYTLTSLAITEPDRDKPGSVDLAMRIDSDSPTAPLLLAFSFGLDELLPALELSAAAVTDTRTAQQVS